MIEWTGTPSQRRQARKAAVAPFHIVANERAHATLAENEPNAVFRRCTGKEPFEASWDVPNLIVEHENCIRMLSFNPINDPPMSRCCACDQVCYGSPPR